MMTRFLQLWKKYNSQNLYPEDSIMRDIVTLFEESGMKQNQHEEKISFDFFVLK